MPNRKRSEGALSRTALAWVLGVLAVLAAITPAPATAADYVVFGQVRQIDPDDAEDESIATADLTPGDPIPFTPVAIYDRNTNVELGSSWTGQNGQFSVAFSAGSPVEVEARASRLVDGGLSPLPAAREGINRMILTSAGPVTSQGIVVKVASDLLTAAGPLASSLPHPGVGIVFTRVGKVEIPYIEQNTDFATPAEVGLADLSGDLDRAIELGLPAHSNQARHRAVFQDAPFGGRLLIFGSFGLPGDGDECIDSSGDPYPIDWYQVTIERIDEASLPSDSPDIVRDSDFVLTDRLSKKRYEVRTFPLVDVITSTVDIGPYTGDEGVAGGPDVPGLYMVNAPEITSTRQVFYSFPDLRANWVSSAHNGLYRLRLRYFRDAGWAVVNEVPIVEEIPASCFVASPPELSDAAVGDLVLRINNEPLTARFNHIWVTGPGGYLASGGGRVPTTAGALDFNATGLCDIIDLHAGDEIEIDFTAHHAGGYLRYYRLSAEANDGSDVAFTGDDWVGKPFPWFGTPPLPPSPLPAPPAVIGTAVTNADPFPHDCGYIFDLVAASRLQNGYHYIQRRHPRRTYYVRP